MTKKQMVGLCTNRY